MTRRELGAAVNVMWVIFLIVLLLGAGAYIYSVQGEIERERTAARRAAADRTALEESLVAERQLHAELSRMVGFVDLGAGDVVSSKAAIEARVEAIRGRFPNDIGGADNTLEAIAERLVAVAEKHDQTARSAADNFASERDKRSESETAKDQIRSSMDGQLNSLNSDLRDERDRAQSQKQQDDSQIAGLQGQVDEVTTQFREQQATNEQSLAQAAKAQRELEARISELSTKVKLVGVDEDPWAPDGEVVAVGPGTGLVFVNLGANDLLRTGVRFDVFRFGKGGELIPKGSLEVREVHAESAVGSIIEQVSSLDPIAAGDVIANPHFSTERSKVFALLGNFPVHGRSFLENRLRALGAEVDDDVTSRVDFVVLGQRSSEEDAPELAELPAYKVAQEMGIQMLPLRTIERFLKP